MPAIVFARPAEIKPPLLALAERIWAAGELEALPLLDDTDDLLAVLLGLDEGAGHEELARCGAPGCGTWFWAEDGADLVDCGRFTTVCDRHASPDTPGVRIFPGPRLAAIWRERDRSHGARTRQLAASLR